MDIFVNGKKINLTQKEWLTKGGEGSIYVKGDTAYKIYENASQAMPEGKRKELSTITMPEVIRPLDVIKDGNNHIVGYTMDYVKDTYALCQLFTKTFKQRENVSCATVTELVKKLQVMIKHIHSKKILVVDLNEMNFLVSKDFQTIYGIDTNSYQTPSYPATAIMDSIRDRHCQGNNFTELTDWFAWGILTFQMFINIHPYKGAHPKYSAGALDERVDARMKANVSVFNPDSKFPKICEPFDIIPPALRGWYKSIFETSNRSLPPDNYDVVAFIQLAQPVIKTLNGKIIKITELFQFDSEIVDVRVIGGTRITTTKTSIYVGELKVALAPLGKKFKLGAYVTSSAPILVDSQQGQPLEIRDIMSGGRQAINMNVDAVFSNNNVVYVKSGTMVLMLSFVKSVNRIIATHKMVGSTLENQTYVFEGGAMQNMLGMQVLSIFDGAANYQVPLKELSGWKVLDAKYEDHVFICYGIDKHGKYQRFVFKFDKTYNTYSVTMKPDDTSINFTVGDNGVVALINGDEELELFRNSPLSDTVNIIKDPLLHGDMKLFHDGAEFQFYTGNKIYKISTK